MLMWVPRGFWQIQMGFLSFQQQLSSGLSSTKATLVESTADRCPVYGFPPSALFAGPAGLSVSADSCSRPAGRPSLGRLSHLLSRFCEMFKAWAIIFIT